MSRIGRKPIQLPQGVTVTAEGSVVTVKGPKGTLSHTFPPVVHVTQKDTVLDVTVNQPDDRSERAFWGMSRALISNMVEGVSKGFEKKLEIKGVGFKIVMQGKKLQLSVGFSHPVIFEAVEGVTLTVEKNTIIISGIDKQAVGETAANIRKIKKPEPYKGKGIRYVGEHVRQKAGKVVKAAGA